MALRRVATRDVRVVFRRAPGGLLFVLVASDLADCEGACPPASPPAGLKLCNITLNPSP